MTRAEKITVSLPAQLLSFVTEYQASYHLSRSEVIQQALQVLRDFELAQAYRESAQEIQADPLFDLFDLEIGHGLSNSVEVKW